MSAALPEFRKLVMTLVEASWKDRDGALQTVPACMEDKSAGGACIRVKTAIEVGSKLSLRWRSEQFSGTVRYCRREGKEYLVGIQRDTAQSPLPNRPVPGSASRPESLPDGGLPVTNPKIKSLPMPQEGKPIESPAPQKANMEDVPIIRIASSTTAPPPEVAAEVDRRQTLSISRLESVNALRRTQLANKQPPKESGEKRKFMPRKWLERSPWRNKQDGSSVSAVVNGEPHGKGNGTLNRDKENLMPQITPPTEKAPGPSAREVPHFQVELLPMEDIYRAAGIITPRKGYSITKVVEMLHSQHIRGLSQEMKRAAVLMALDAADISLEQLQYDAKARQEALDSHEADQRKQVEGEWARKAEEIIQIQAELESIKAHYTARIGRNLEGVAKEKATFNAWLGIKQKETQDMSEAVNLCLKSPAAEPVSAPPSELSMARAAAAAGMQESRSDGIH